MKYYIYISDAKVDMLLPQVPHEVKRKVAMKFGFDLKILKAERQSETEMEDNRITRLETVVSFIREYGNVGTVDDPDAYIDDTQVVNAEYLGNESNGIVYFSGSTDRTKFGIAGSLKHMLGYEGISPSLGNSTLAKIAHWIAYWEALDERSASNAGKMYNSVYNLAGRQSGVGQRLEFLARQLAFCNNYRHCSEDAAVQVLLATPLYIAMTD